MNGFFKFLIIFKSVEFYGCLGKTFRVFLMFLERFDACVGIEKMIF
jgi:hypothetical protein